MKIEEGDQIITTLNTAKTIQVLADMLEERRAIELQIEQDNKAAILAQRIKRDEFVNAIIKNKLIEEFTLKTRDDEVKRIKGVYERSIEAVRVPKLFGKREALKRIADFQVCMANEIDTVSKYVPVSFNEQDKSFKHANSSNDFNHFIKYKYGMEWVVMEMEIKTLLTTEESIKLHIRKLKCIHDEAFIAADLPADLTFTYGSKKVNIWEYKL